MQRDLGQFQNVVNSERQTEGNAFLEYLVCTFTANIWEEFCTTVRLENKGNKSEYYIFRKI